MASAPARSSATPGALALVPTITTRTATLPPETSSTPTTSTTTVTNGQPTPPKQKQPPPILKDTLRGRTKTTALRPHTLHKLHSAFSPSTHDRDEKLPPSQSATARPYLHRRQRWRMWRLSIGEFFFTLLLCLSYFLIIYLYSLRDTINRDQRHYFNALTTGNALLLGVNLAGSLRSYAKMLRWRILASRYRTLANFDLIMGCHDVVNVFKLFWHSKWFGITQIFCLIWIAVQLGCAVGVGAIGLTYNLEVSTDWVNIQTGNTSVINMGSLLGNDYLSSLARVQGWGFKGDTLVPDEGLLKSDLSKNGSLYLWSWEGEGIRTRYFFRDRNPVVGEDNYVEVDVTDRIVDSVVFCKAYDVTEGEYGDLPYIIYRDTETGDEFNETIYEQPGPSGLYVTSDFNSSCGPRCTTLTTFQARSIGDGSELIDDPWAVYIDYAVRFSCNNTISEVLDARDNLTHYPVYQFSDTIARMLAGTFGWSDNPPVTSIISHVGNETHPETNVDSNQDGKRIEFISYANASEIGYRSTPNVANMAYSIACFTMGGVASMDSFGGIYRMFVIDGEQPVQAQYLRVKWWAAGLILGLIPFVHFVSLTIVIALANRAIIKDDTHLSISKLYYSVLGRLGLDKGCILTGDEIIDELGNPSVAYGWTTGSDPSVSGAKGLTPMHVDIFEQTRGMRIERAFPEGIYDGYVLRQRKGKQEERTSLQFQKKFEEDSNEEQWETDVPKADHEQTTSREREIDARAYF